ncbi:hypothetical protein [Saccharomonospora marina]|uniref:hypothetical protein n=1 Tax=Saccharomonospora marina TaxID=632569 RepID=UPI0002FF41CF|nr:hypothetical protein [Saccharomonospora marina]
MAARRLLSAVAALLLLTGCTDKVIAPSSPVSELGPQQFAAGTPSPAVTEPGAFQPR